MKGASVSSEKFSEWCVVELLGHRRLGALVSEQEIAGAAFLRLNVYTTPAADGAEDKPALTQFVSPGSIYALTPTTEEIARAVAAANTPQPLQRWALPAPRPASDLPVYGETTDDPEYEPDRDDEDDDIPL